MVSNGYMAFRLEEAPEGIVYLNDPINNPSHETMREHVSTRAFRALDENDIIPIAAPDMQAVKACKAAYKAQGNSTGIFTLGHNLPSVNTTWLIDAIRVFPGAYWYVSSKSPLAFVYAHCQEGDAVICPIRMTKEARVMSEEVSGILPSDVTSDQATDAPADAAPDQATDAPADAAPDQTTDAPADAAPDQTTDAPADVTSDQATDAPADVTPDQATDAPADVTSDQATDAPAAPVKHFIGLVITGKTWYIYFDPNAERTRIVFQHDPKPAAKAILDKAGFYYSPRMKSFNKRLTFKAYRAAMAVSEELKRIYA